MFLTHMRVEPPYFVFAKKCPHPYVLRDRSLLLGVSTRSGQEKRRYIRSGFRGDWTRGTSPLTPLSRNLPLARPNWVRKRWRQRRVIVGGEAISPSEFLKQSPINLVRVQMLIVSVYRDLLAMHRHIRVRFCPASEAGASGPGFL